MTKRRRVYSLQPNTLPRAVFTKKYANHLVPALMNIGRNKDDSGERKDHDKLQKLVRHEVDQALVSSAQGFAWSSALNLELQRRGNVAGLQNSETQKPSLPNKDSSRKHSKRSKTSHCPSNKKRGGGKESQEVQFRQQLTNLRTLLPGGNEMGVNQLLTEVGSYLVALELQVNVLRCLVETH